MSISAAEEAAAAEALRHVTAAKKVYIAGPMAGIKDYNYPMFNLFDTILTSLGFDVVNPAELDAEEGWPLPTATDDFYVATEERAGYMRRDLPYVVQCDAIVLLPDWQMSVGANIELLTALVCGLEVWEAVETEDGDVGVAYSDAKPDLFAIAYHVFEATS